VRRLLRGVKHGGASSRQTLNPSSEGIAAIDFAFNEFGVQN
jgi:hypothetical protein